MPLTQEEPRYEFQKHFSVTNNNDHSYLHKKFKKMATVHPPLEEKGHTSSHDNISSLNITAELKKGDIVQYETNESTTNIERLNISTVQINFKGNENHLNLVKQTNDKSVFRDDKIDKTEYMDTELQRNQQNGGNGRHVCPYCKLSCAKPSVLQKHIRAHTNERPFPCVPCGFAFKTKSNYYKHSRTRTHALRINNNGVINESEWAGDIENDLHSTSENNTDISCLEDVRPSSVSSCESSRDRVSPSFSSTSNLTRAQDNIKGKSIYKPKFHRPYKEEEQQKKVLPTNAEFLNEHISKIISDNEAIVDVLDVPLQKKYNKIKQIAETKHMETDEMFHENRNEQPLNLHKTTPLNLSKSIEGDNQNRKRNFSESFQSGDSTKVTFNASKPTNPERSIIKDLLLKTKAFSGPNENYDNTDVLFVCQLCNIPHRNAEIHRLYYCKGKRNGHLIKSSSLSPNDSKITKPEQIYARSHSVNVTLSETNCSTTFIKVPNGVSQVRKKPDDIFIKSNEIIVDTPLPSPGPLLGNTRLVEEPKAVRKTPETTKMAPEVIVLQQKSSPKRFEWKNTRMLIENAYSKPSKIRCLESMNSSRQTTASLQMYGGEIKILNTGSASRKLRGSLSGISPIKPGEESRPHNLHSGVRIIQNSSPPIEVRVCSRPETPNYKISITPQINPKLSLPTTSINFPFSPLGAITAYNPLTLPPLSPSFNSDEGINIFHGGKIIPHVPGIPGPNTQITASNYSNTSKIQNTLDLTRKGNGNTVIMEEGSRFFKKLDSTATPKLKHHSSSQIDNIETESVNSPNCSKPQPALLNLPLIKIRNADDKQESNDNLESYNIATTKLDITRKAFEEPISGDKEATTFNFENFISKSEIANNQNDEITDAQNSFPNNFERSEPLYFQKNKIIKPLKEEIKSKFLRPSTLPLKPGTFTPKKHHGITPNANTMPLISPETPRPAKAYGQLYLNGNAYTYLGLKCSTKVYYCTVNRPQPTYVPNQHSLSMYSNWQICSEVTPHPLGLTAGAAMFLYDSRHRPQDYSVAKIQTECVSTHSSQLKSEERQYQKSAMTLESKTAEAKCTINESLQKGKELAGGFESNEEYTYVRGRGRGRYVCSECGIRCKKPSMLKKHIRTHTDVRPYTCKHCAFSFKTKGNLTKHMKSKAHYKRCCELGINPSEGGECVDMEIGETNQGVGDTDEETESENDEGMEGETESSDTDSWKSRLPEREAAHCLLSLSRASPGIISSARPCTYPYAPTRADENIPINAENQLNEPMDLSKSEIKAPEIILSREHSILVSLASNTAKLPQQKSEWTNGEPMLNAYLTEKALQDTKIKQSQLITGVNKVKLDESKPPSSSLSLVQLNQINHNPTNKSIAETSVNLMVSQPVDFSKTSSSGIDTLADVAASSARIASNSNEIPKLEVVNTSMENAKLLASEYLKMARSKFSENIQSSERPEIVEDKPSTESKYRNDEDYEIRIDNAIKPQNENEGVASKVVIGAGGVAFKVTSKSSEYQNNAYLPGRLTDDGRAVCNVCNKTFSKQSQLRLHINIHYMERPFRCSACGVSFRTKGHLQKHERSSTHLNKVSMTSTFGAATTSNPRPFKCTDCVTSFRIHGHLAKHLRSKMHVMRLECSGKLPFGTFAEIERAGVSLTDIDTTDCANSLASLQLLAQKLHEKDPTKLETWDPNTMVPPLLPAGKESSDEEDNGVEAKVKQQSVKDISEVKLHKQINTEEKTY